MPRKTTRFFTKGKGPDRTVHPITEPMGINAKKAHFVHPSRQAAYDRHIQSETKKMQMTVAVPRNADVVIVRKPHNPTEVEIKPLRDPHTGAPLEPAKEYGKTIVYDPYTGASEMVTTPGEERVKPRFTEVEEKGLRGIRSNVDQAADIMEKDHSEAAMNRAYRLLHDSMVQSQTQPYSGVTGEAIRKDPSYRELATTYGVVKNSVASASETSDPVAKAHHIKIARERLQTAKKNMHAME